MEKSILTAIADNPALLEAVRKIVEDEFSFDVDSRWIGDSVGISDKDLGEIVRARIEGLKKVGNAFRKIEHYKTVSERDVNKNPAR